MKSKDRQKNLLTPSDASHILGVSSERVRQMEREGTLTVAIRTERGLRLFFRGDVENLAVERAQRRAARKIEQETALAAK